MKYIVKRASTKEDRCLIYILRYAVYIEEMGFSYPTADHEKKMLYDEYDDSAYQYFLTNDLEEEAFGIFRYNTLDFSQINPIHECRYQISFFKNLGVKVALASKLMIRKEFRNLVFVNLLIKESFICGIQQGFLITVLDCSPELIPFYERMGFRKYYINFMDSILGEKVPMVLFAEDLVHLEKVKSPLYKVCCDMKVKYKDYTSWFECNKIKHEEYA